MSEENPNEYRIPKRINEPLTLIIWPTHHILPVFMSIATGVVFDDFVIHVSIGIGWFFLIREIERRYPKGYLMHRFWWAGLINKETKSIPDALKREYFQ